MATGSLIYTNGTRDARTSAWADDSRIEAFESQCGAPIAATFAEHLKLGFAQTDSEQHQIAARRRLSSNQMAIFERCFPKRLILDAQPYGRPTIRNMLYSGVEYPGDDPETLEALQIHKHDAIVLCSPQTREQAERDFQEEWEPLEIDEDDFADLGLAERWGLDFSYLPELQLLVRDQVGEHSAAGKCWKVVGFDGDLASASALAVVAEESYPRECLERACSMSGWGLISMTKVLMHATLRSVAHLAYGGLVSAERQRRREELRRREPARKG
jgi:hypothetical protein